MVTVGAYTAQPVPTTGRALSNSCPSLEEGHVPRRKRFFSGQLEDPRIGAAITMAGGRGSLFGDSGHLGVDIPMMLMSGNEDGDGIPNSWTELDSIHWLELIGGCHESFAMGVCSTLDPELGFSLVNAYSLALGRSVVLGDGDPEIEALLSARANSRKGQLFRIVGKQVFRRRCKPGRRTFHCTRRWRLRGPGRREYVVDHLDKSPSTPPDDARFQ